MKMSTIISSSVLALSLLCGVNANAAEQIIVTGSTTVLPIMQKASEAYMAANPNIEIALSGGGSGNGIKAVIDSLCDIGMASRDIKSSEVEAAKKKGVTPTRVVVGLDALLPVVNPKNPVKELSLAQLKDIYAGNIKNWKELGGNDAPIVVVSRDTSSGTYETWLELVMDKERVVPTALLQASNGSTVQTVSTNANAIGYIGFGYMNDTLQAISVDGVVASQETALNGDWKISRELYVFTSDKPSQEVQDFIAYLVDPEKGQKAVEAVGYIKLQAK